MNSAMFLVLIDLFGEELASADARIDRPRSELGHTSGGGLTLLSPAILPRGRTDVEGGYGLATEAKLPAPWVSGIKPQDLECIASLFVYNWYIRYYTLVFDL